MLEVIQISYSRHEVNQKGDSYSSVGRRVGIDPRTVRNTLIKRNFQ